MPITKMEYAVSANVIIVKPRKHALYVYYTLKSDYIDKQVDLSIHATTQPAFGMEKIRALKIKKPMSEEQDAIADILIQFDDYLFQLQNDLEKLTLIRQGLLFDLVTGKVRI